MPCRYTVLHIEDDHEYAEMLQMQLSRIAARSGLEDLEFTVVPDVAGAKNMLSGNAFDCIVCDYQVIGGTGLDVLGHVRSTCDLVPVIFLTGQGDESVAREAFVRGADDYFTKDAGIASYDRIYNAIIHQISHYSIERDHQALEMRYASSQKKYYTLFHNAPDAIFLMDEYVIRDCNPSAVELLGYSVEELCTMQPHHISPEYQPDGSDSLTRSKLLISKTLQGEPQRFVWQHVKKDGSTLMAEIRLSPLFFEQEALIMAIIRDISPLHDLSYELNESRRRLSTLTQNIPGMTYQCSVEYPWVLWHVSSGCERLTGYGNNELLSPPLGTFGSIIHPDDIGKVRDVVEQALAAQASYEVTYRILCKSGGYRNVFERGREVADECGMHVLEGIVISSDLDNETGYAAATNAHQDLIDIFPLAVIMYGISNGNLTPLYENSAARSIPHSRATGQSFAAHLASTFSSRLLQEDGEEMQHLPFQARYESMEGIRFFKVRPFRYAPDVIYVVCADYTHQAELEKMSSESHKRLERIMSLVSDINILDIDKVLKKVAEYIRTIVPYDGMVIFAIDKERNVFVPRYCDDELRDAIMPLTFPLDRGVTGRVAHNGVPEIVNVTKLDKDALHVPGTPDSDERLLSFPLIGHEGTIGALNLYRSSEDFFLSDLRETSLISPHVAVALENALLYEKLSKEYDFINFLISLLSHDLKNPLMVSDGLLDILDHIGAAKAELPKLRWANQRMKNILERIQIFASLEYGLIEREYRNIEISSLIGEVREHFENHPKSASVTYCCEGGNASIYALGILPHIFINLIDNALKYCSACTVSCRLSGGMVTFCIADDGPGIPLEKRQVIFSKYARLDPDCAVSGSGIGLYVAHKLVELHHGTIAIEDNVPHGTVFLVSLPQDCRMKDVFGT